MLRCERVGLRTRAVRRFPEPLWAPMASHPSERPFAFDRCSFSKNKKGSLRSEDSPEPADVVLVGDSNDLDAPAVVTMA